MCIVRRYEVQDGKKADINYIYTWNCCYCGDLGGPTKIHVCCQHCGHWRCNDSTASSSDSSGSTSTKPLVANAVSQFETYLGEFQRNFRDLESKAATIGNQGLEKSSSLTVVPTRLLELAEDAPTIAAATCKASELVKSMISGNDSLDIRIAKWGPKETEEAGHEASRVYNFPDDRFKAQPPLSQDNFLSSKRSVSEWPMTEAYIKSTDSVWQETSSDVDSTDTEICTPEGSDDRPLTGSHGSGTVIATPDVPDEMDEQDIGPIGSEGGSPRTHILGTLTSTESMGSFRGDLLERPWFHHQVRRVLRTLLRQWPDVQPRTHSNSAENTRSSEQQQQQQSPNQHQCSSDPGKRRQRTQSDDEDNQRDASIGPKRRRLSEEPREAQGFACPFSKKDLQRHQSCAKFSFTRIRDVKQHIRRNHCNDVDEPTRSLLRQRSTRGRSREEQWYEIFDNLFPEHSPRPVTPYNDFTLSEYPLAGSHGSPSGIPLDEALYIPREYLTEDGAEILQQELIQDPAFRGLNAGYIRTAVSRGLTRILHTFDHGQQQHFPVHTHQSALQHDLQRDRRDHEQISNNHESNQHLYPVHTNFGDDSEHRNNPSSFVPTNRSPAFGLDHSWDSGNEGRIGQDDPFQDHFNALLIDEQLGGQEDGLGLDMTAGEEGIQWDSNFWPADILEGGGWECLGEGNSLDKSSETLPSREPPDS